MIIGYKWLQHTNSICNAHEIFVHVPTASYIQCSKFRVLQRFVGKTALAQSNQLHSYDFKCILA